MADSTAIFNPEAFYRAPPGGAVVSDLIYIDQSGELKHTGPIKIIGGTTILYDPQAVSD